MITLLKISFTVGILSYLFILFCGWLDLKPSKFFRCLVAALLIVGTISTVFSGLYIIWTI